VASINVKTERQFVTLGASAGLWKSQKIRMRLGGSTSMLDAEAETRDSQ
jgi:hypothetical protein